MGRISSHQPRGAHNPRPSRWREILRRLKAHRLLRVVKARAAPEQLWLVSATIARDSPPPAINRWGLGFALSEGPSPPPPPGLLPSALPRHRVPGRAFGCCNRRSAPPSASPPTPSLPGPGMATSPSATEAAPKAPRPGKAVPVSGFRGRLPPSQAGGPVGDPVTPENPPTPVYGAP